MADSVRSVKSIRVVGAAIVNAEGQVLCVQRGQGKSLAGYWEFPGGKIEDGETPRRALRREIHEELGCDVLVGDEVCTAGYLYDFGRVELAVFLCRMRADHPRRSEHAQLKWVRPERMPALNWAPVDRDAVRAISRMQFAGEWQASVHGEVRTRYGLVFL
ncbi:(deoxy)nucleoside triphosphate pyrophosphohydrolase [Bifidobacterium cuniculi]|uniref:8-oxo-dGTP diphosphatase n=1 Tax=Bifidobacterium cuniculi TaxID=1688 RepID=A0A087B0J9_9BIFI|nr:(deoxy)nucleoside triphosphate pyrophosphohydrolase [Bifidobacterium cuniculi]KFI64549.1 mutator MutT protein [Bifidobacterium cuniculi]